VRPLMENYLNSLDINNLMENKMNFAETPDIKDIELIKGIKLVIE